MKELSNDELVALAARLEKQVFPFFQQAFTDTALSSGEMLKLASDTDKLAFMASMTYQAFRSAVLLTTALLFTDGEFNFNVSQFNDLIN